eukprot:TRINITY_DN820_c0_g1_i1.p1 TRINITY_DN820_c0_g1~~TRINITY_DN820_c0_g1_i1.p1  ORF type:complete len:293 (+),score=64.60 TRINITY_DN820_c0_g1_i1:181-1059(+)
MVADCGATFAKYLLCLFNFIFFVVGSAVLCIGIWLAIDKASFIQLTRFSQINNGLEVQDEVKSIIRELTEPTVIEQGAYILIAAGAFIFIISFLGYCGAIKESKVLLTAYGIFIIIITMLQIAAIVLVVLYKTHAEQHSKEFFRHTIQKYYTTKGQRDAVTITWDFMMAELHCCGVDNSEDFRSAVKFMQLVNANGNKQVIPEACCKLDPSVNIAFFKPADDQCTREPTPLNSYIGQGCFSVIHSWIMTNLRIVIGVAIGILGIQLVGIIFAFCLCRAVGHYADYTDYPSKY